MKKIQILNGLSSSSRRLILVGVTLALCIMTGNAVLGLLLRHDAEQTSERAISSLSVVLAEQSARAFEAVDRQVRELRDLATQSNPDNAGAFQISPGSWTFHEELVMRSQNMPQAIGLSTISASGRVANTDRAWPVPDTDVSDRDYYRHFLAHPDDDGVFVSMPVQNRIDGRWTLFLARRVAAADGNLAGVILGGIDLRYFSNLYASIGLAKGSLITLLRRDGVAVAEYPERPGIVGSYLPAASDWYRFSKNESAQYRFAAPFGGGYPLFVALRHVRGYNFVVNVAIEEPYVFVGWHRLVTLLALGSGPGMLVLFGLLRALTIQFRRIEAAEATARQRNQELEETRHRLEVTLEHMEEGLIMIAADDRLSVCNRRAQQLLNISEAMSHSRPALSALLADALRAGESDKAMPELRILTKHDEGWQLPHQYEWPRSDGTVVEVRTVPLTGGGIVRTYADVTERRRAEDRVRHSAHHDALTGLPNRLLLRERLECALRDARLHCDGVGVLFLDLDRFKLANDTYGHAIGDQVLVAVAARLGELVRGPDTIARMGGDEFVVVLTEIHERESTTMLAQRMVKAFGEPFTIGPHQVSIGLSVGLALFPEDGGDAEELLRNADRALYRAKNKGRHTVCSFDPVTDAYPRPHNHQGDEPHAVPGPDKSDSSINQPELSATAG